MNKTPDAWEDEWSSAVDVATPPQETNDKNSTSSGKKASTKVTKAQKRAQQAEFNRQLWAEAEGPRETNYFLESRNVVPLRSEFKPAPILLSRKGPIIQARPQTQNQSNNATPSQSQPLTTSLNNLTLATRKITVESSDEDDDEDPTRRKQTLAERQAQALREREEKQRKYDERRLELFGAPTISTNTNPSNNASSILTNAANMNTNTKSGTSSPSSLTPPGSRSSTPNSRGRGRGRRVGGVSGNRELHNMTTGAGVIGGGMHQQPQQSQPKLQYQYPQNVLQSHQAQIQQQSQISKQQHGELYDPTYSPKPESTYLQTRRTEGLRGPNSVDEIRPVRTPRGPDANGRGFTALRGGKSGLEPHSTTLTNVVNIQTEG